jgi:hypothetical protein
MKGATSSELLESELDYEIEHEEDTPSPEHTPSAGGTSTAGSSVPERTPKKRTQNTNGVAVAGGAEILKFEVLDEEGKHCEELPSGGTLTARVHLRYEEAMEQSTLGISVQSEERGLRTSGRIRREREFRWGAKRRASRQG